MQINTADRKLIAFIHIQSSEKPWSEISDLQEQVVRQGNEFKKRKKMPRNRQRRNSPRSIKLSYSNVPQSVPPPSDRLFLLV
jgi:hypothetical protein